jgi:ABC-type polysaccharide/polyol phosphate transport system ATPase subunit
MSAIEFRHVTKYFRHGKPELLGALVFRQLLGSNPNKTANSFPALRDINFTVREGEVVGLVGSNGAGKSTLLALASGVTEPDEGQVNVAGTSVPLLDLGAGFHPDLTGEENLRLNASLLGVSRARTEEFAARVIEFADIGEFIRDPLRVYSAGMTMRLAFSVAVHLDPDVFLIDEIIGVGDAAFQDKCKAKVLEFRNRGKTILMASHSAAFLLEQCDYGLWLDHGAQRAFGDIRDVVEEYQNAGTLTTPQKAR